MFLFLQGPPRAGKSTVLRNALLPRQDIVAGLMVQRLFEDGQLCGFRACAVGGTTLPARAVDGTTLPARAADGTTLPALEASYTEGLSGVFLHKGKADIRILEETIVLAKTFCEKETCKLIILDEIGGVELTSAAFMTSLEGILRLGKPCLGVMKSPENLVRTAGRLDLPPDILRQNEELRTRLKAAGSVLDTDSGSLDAAARAVDEFIARALVL